MKQLLLIATMALSTLSFAQEVKSSERSVSFANGSHNAVVVSVPFAKKDQVEKALKSEMKDWGGKFSSDKGEFMASQTSMKAMGDKMFDGYAKIIESGDNIEVAFAVDLGGAYMTSSQHGSQFKYIQEKAKKFAVSAASSAVDDELAVEAKVLKELEKNKSDLEKSIESDKKSIEDYKKKIADAEQRIKDNESALSKKGDEISTQTSKIGDVEKKKKSIK